MGGGRFGGIALGAALALGLLWFTLETYRNEPAMGPGDDAYLDGNSQFSDRHYQRAAELYARALKQKSNHVPALRGLANAQVQLKHHARALAAINRAIAFEPGFGGNYAIRGIVHDHLGRHGEAIADYETALALEPGVAEGMSWLDRLLYNVQERPPTVAERLAYLRAQMALPESKRVLARPEIDAKQRPYER